MSIKGKAVGWALKLVGARLGGVKPYVLGAGMILAGLAGLVGAMVPDGGIPALDVDSSLGLIALGGATIAGKKVADKQDAVAAGK